MVASETTLSLMHIIRLMSKGAFYQQVPMFLDTMQWVQRETIRVNALQVKKSGRECPNCGEIKRFQSELYRRFVSIVLVNRNDVVALTQLRKYIVASLGLESTRYALIIYVKKKKTKVVF